MRPTSMPRPRPRPAWPTRGNAKWALDAAEADRQLIADLHAAARLEDAGRLTETLEAVATPVGVSGNRPHVAGGPIPGFF